LAREKSPEIMLQTRERLSDRDLITMTVIVMMSMMKKMRVRRIKMRHYSINLSLISN
jgi:hypothetical protein